MGKIKHIGHMLKKKTALPCLVLAAVALALTGCEQPDNTVKDYIITDDGTWEIYTADGLLAWNKYVTDKENYVLITESEYSYYMLEANAMLMADITLPEVEQGQSNWTPIKLDIVQTGTMNNTAIYTYGYSSTFDGNGHTISNLKIDLEEDTNVTGMFGLLNGVVKNLTLSDIEISAGWETGGIAGVNGGTIENCSVSGSISGKYGVGGIVGVNYDTITACYNTGNVEGTDDVGGIVGHNNNQATVKACYSTGSISGNDSSTYVGGIAGAVYNPNSIIDTCYWSVPEGSSANYGIGNEPGSTATTKVDGNDVTWYMAMKEMNKELSGSGYTYEANKNEETNTIMPLVIKKSSI